MGVIDSLTAWGIQRATDVVPLAVGAALPLAAAAALLEQESGGGANVWGHDAVATGGAYVKGAPVVEADYRRYRAALAAGTAGQQGVGPCQLTARGYQDQADALRGCWDPASNMIVGFGLLAGYCARWGLADAFRAYNGGAGNRVAGSNANADAYSASAMAKYARWVDRLGPDSSRPGVVPVPIPAVVPTPLEVEPMIPIPIFVRPDGSYRAVAVCEAGSSSLAVDRAWVVVGLGWGGSADVLVTFLDAVSGLVMGQQYRAHVENNRRLSVEAPSGCGLVTVEGQATQGAQITGSIIVRSKP